MVHYVHLCTHSGSTICSLSFCVRSLFLFIFVLYVFTACSTVPAPVVKTYFNGGGKTQTESTDTKFYCSLKIFQVGFFLQKQCKFDFLFGQGVCTVCILNQNTRASTSIWSPLGESKKFLPLLPIIYYLLECQFRFPTLTCGSPEDLLPS